MTEIERFWSKTARRGKCIVWKAGCAKNGYGLFSVKTPKGSKRRHKTIYAHRYIYARVFGSIPPKKDVMHSCDRRGCVSLQHLSPGSRKRNMEDAVAKQRTQRGEDRPTAKLTAKSVREIRRRCARGESQASIAADLGVHQVTVGKAATGKTWKHSK
jgi:hypothetical protein